MNNDLQELMEVLSFFESTIYFIAVIVFFFMAYNVSTIAKFLKRSETSPINLREKIAAEKFKGNKENVINLLLQRAWTERNDFRTDSQGRAEMLHNTAQEIEKFGGTVPDAIIDYLEKYKK